MASVVKWKVEGDIFAHRDVFLPAGLGVSRVWSGLWQPITNNSPVWDKNDLRGHYRRVLVDEHAGGRITAAPG